ncbi:hypothetical protein ABK040_015314 [Willaertia magna]
MNIEGLCKRERDAKDHKLRAQIAGMLQKLVKEEKDVEELLKCKGFETLQNLLVSDDALTRKRASATLCNISVHETSGKPLRETKTIDVILQRINPQIEDDLSVLENITSCCLNIFLDKENIYYLTNTLQKTFYHNILNYMVENLKEFFNSGIFDENIKNIVYNLLICISSLALDPEISTEMNSLGIVTFLIDILLKINLNEIPPDLLEGLTASLWNLLLNETIKKSLFKNSNEKVKLFLKKLIELSESKEVNVKKNVSNIIQILSNVSSSSNTEEDDEEKLNNDEALDKDKEEDLLGDYRNEMIQKCLNELKNSVDFKTNRILDIDQIKSSAGILWNMAGNTREDRLMIKEKGGVDLLCNLFIMTIDKFDLLYKVSGALGSLSLTESNALEIGNHPVQIITKCLQFLQKINSAVPFTILENILTILNNLTILQENRKQIYDLGGIPILINFLKISKEGKEQLDKIKLAEKASNILTNMAIDDESSTKIREEGGIEYLVNLVSIQEDLAILQSNTSSPSKEILKGYDFKDVKKKAAHTLWNLMILDENLKRIEQVGGLKPLVNLLPSTDLDEIVSHQLRKKEKEEEGVPDIDEHELNDNSEEEEEEEMVIQRKKVEKKEEKEEKSKEVEEEPIVVDFTKEHQKQAENILKKLDTVKISSVNNTPTTPSSPVVVERKTKGQLRIEKPTIVVEEPKKTVPKIKFAKQEDEITVKRIEVKPKQQEVNKETKNEESKKEEEVAKKETKVIFKEEVEVKQPVEVVKEEIKQPKKVVVEQEIKKEEVKQPVKEEIKQEIKKEVKQEEIKQVEVKQPVEEEIVVKKQEIKVDQKVEPEVVEKVEPKVEVKQEVKTIEPVVEVKEEPVKQPIVKEEIKEPLKEEVIVKEEVKVEEVIQEEVEEPKDEPPRLTIEDSIDVDTERLPTDDSSTYDETTIRDTTVPLEEEEEEEVFDTETERDDMMLLQNIYEDDFQTMDNDLLMTDELSVTPRNSVNSISPRNSNRHSLKRPTTKLPFEYIPLERRVNQILLFYETEKIYLSTLEVIDRNLIANESVKTWIGRKSHSEIFSDLDCIKMINRDLFTELKNYLEAYLEEGDDENKEIERYNHINDIQIGRIILKRTPTLRLYKTFCNNLEKLLKTLTDIESCNTLYNNFFDKYVSKELSELLNNYYRECSKLNVTLLNNNLLQSKDLKLSDLLLNFLIERVSFYSNWLQEMAYKQTDSNCSDFESLQEAHQQIQAINDYCLQKYQELEKIEKFSKMLKEGNLLLQNRKYYTMENLGFPEPDNLNEKKIYKHWKKNYDDEVKKVKKAWNKKKLTEITSGSSSIKNLIKKYGIHSSFRPKVWMEISGAQQKLNENTGYYKKILSVHISQSKTPWIDQIEKDLRRTYVHHPYFNDDKVLAAMRRILIAYSWRNPLVSYCQAFNFIVGMMLLHLSEEEVFWLFVSVVEDYLPANYYSPELKGVLVDAFVFDELLNMNLSKLANHFKSLEFDISTFTMSFFMKLFTVDFPIETTLRFWDCFLCFGSQMLFRGILAVLKLNQDIFLKCKDMAECLLTMQDLIKTSFDCQKIMKTAFNFSKITHDKIALQRKKFIPLIEAELKRQADLRNR